MHYLLAYLVTINALTFLFMFLDKKKARSKQWRIPENILLGLSGLGGSIGATLGMKVFRHKTRSSKFSLGLPMILTLQVLLVLMLVVMFL